ncbi:DMT family transporter [Alkalihalobacterium chitinilyticum]|uniref:DMT family transporter n=1 Tax=Alkalihalobacterium chitinilyticum TaxID=2980103 RepID=A0ABT5V928_9BACI|nr:DMT family transporter [Alkalihalobacterium chitinilyticum]MDE5411842.1 DMT family transporter [Alkalihalobacterium chitinilyticum]
MNNTNSNMFTYVLLMFVMVIWGMNVVFIKMLVDVFPTVTMTSFRVFLAGVVAITVCILIKQLRKFTKVEWKYIFIATIFGVTGHHFFLAWGLTTTTASNTALILALLPLTTSILASVMLKDSLSRLRVVGIIFAFCGVASIILQSGESFTSINVGDVSIFIAMFVQAVSFIYIKKGTNTIDSRVMTAVMLVVGSSFLFVISLFAEPAGTSQMIEQTGWIWGIFLVSSIFATALGHFLFNAAIHRLGAGQTAVFNNFVPFFGLVFSALWLGEQITLLQLTGFVFIVLGVLLGTGFIDEYVKRRVLKKRKVQKAV